MKRMFVIGFALAAMAAAPVLASTFLAMDTADLVQNSSAVAEVEVLEVHSYWNAAGQIIVSDAMVKVDGLVVGDSSLPTILTVRTFGGTVNGYTVDAHGFPTFTRGERQLLFLERDATAADTMRVTGYQQGQYRIVKDAQGQDLAIPAVDGEATLLRADGGQVKAPSQLPLEQLESTVRAEALRQGRPVVE